MILNKTGGVLKQPSYF